MPSIRPIDSDMILDLPAIAQPAIQPDGSFVAYVRSSVNRESMRTDARIELVSFEGGGVRVMTSGLPAANPAWAPGGDMLGFLRPVKDGGPQQVWLLAGGGGEARQLTDLPSGVSEFAWSPNSRTICAVADVDPDARDAAGHVPRGIAVHNVYYRGDTLGWRGDAHYHLFSIDVASGKPQQITRGTFDHRAPTFSPDGKRIAFVSARRRDREHRRPFGGEVCVMPAQGGTVRRLAPDVLQADGIAWSPDGKRLAAVLVESDEWLQPYLFVIDVRTGRRRRLTRDDITPAMGFNPLTAPPPPMWMGDRIFFEADAHGTSGVSSATTGGRVRAERSKKEMHNGISISAQSRRMVLVVSTLRQPAELVAQVLGDSRSVRLTRATADYMRAHPPGKVKRIRVRRAGLDVDCWLLFPPNFQPERRYPLVLEIHGGPNSWYGEGFSPLHQIIAGAGHLVLFTNPRGSLTYGHDFADAVTANWGGEDYLDLMAVVDKVCNRPYVDATRLGIHGYSYGGYMASWIRRAHGPLPSRRGWRAGHQPRLDVRHQRYRRVVGWPPVGRPTIAEPGVVLRAGRRSRTSTRCARPFCCFTATPTSAVQSRRVKNTSRRSKNGVGRWSSCVSPTARISSCVVVTPHCAGSTSTALWRGSSAGSRPAPNW